MLNPPFKGMDKFRLRHWLSHTIKEMPICTKGKLQLIPVRLKTKEASS
jgi:hypothetical protein